MTFSEALKRFREAQGLSQAAVARTLNIKPPLYQRYEWGKTTPSVEFVIKLSKIYGVSADYLLGLSDEPHPKKYDEQEVREAFALRDALKTVMSK